MSSSPASRARDAHRKPAAAPRKTTPQPTVRAAENRPGTGDEFGALFELAAVGAAQADVVTKKLVRCNRRLCEMLGYSESELRERTFMDVTVAEDVPPSLEFHAQMARGEATHVAFEKRLLRKDGTHFWAHLTVAMLRDANGEPRRTIAAIQDISGRKLAEERLRQNEAELAAIFAHAAVGLSEISLEGRFVRVNEAFCAMLGFTREELLAQGVQQVTHPEDRERSLQTLGELLATGRQCRLEKRYRRADGSFVWAESMLSRLDDDLGQPRAVLAVTVDLTTSKEAAAAVRESEERLRRAIEIETVGIVFFRMDGRITEANDAFLRLAGIDRRELAGGTLRLQTMTPTEWLPSLRNSWEELRSLGRTRPQEQEFIKRDGSRWWALLASTRLDENEAVGYLIDVTERKANDEELHNARENLEERVHERTAEIDAINGALRDEIIERERSEAARQELLRQLVTIQEDERRRISRELHDQVGQLLTALMLGLRSVQARSSEPAMVAEIAQLHGLAEQVGREVHDMALALRPTALDDLGLLRTLSNYVDRWSQLSGIEIDFHSSGWKGERLPPQVETTVYRIVQEALTNVIKHARAHRVSLIVERRSDQAVAIVEDDGVGFDPAALAGPTAGKRLGLLGMKERAALVDGEVNIESTPRGGTTVFVRIPLRAKPTA